MHKGQPNAHKVYIERLRQIAKSMMPDSFLILKAPEVKLRNRDVHFEYRNSSDLIYLTGYNTQDFILCLNSNANVIIYFKFPDPAQERWTGKMLSPAEVIKDLNLDEKNVREYKNFQADLPDLLKNQKNLYLDFSLENEDLKVILKTVNDLNKNTRDVTFGPSQIINSAAIIHESRVKKSADEIEKIQKAAQITRLGFIKAMSFTRSKDTLWEYEVKAIIEQVFKENGADQLAYPTIAAAGNNINYLHYTGSQSAIGKNDLILIDAGCEWQHYAADVSRTFPAGGKFTTEQREIYSLVLTAQKNAIEQCKAGNTMEDVHQAAVRTLAEGLWDMGFFKEIPDENANHQMVRPASIDEVIEKKYYRLYYMHYTGHFLGLDVHDVGLYYKEDKARPLETGMVFTVEPGIYISADYDFVPQAFRGIGVRIEDDVLIGGNKEVDVLTFDIPKEIRDIENLT